jgi:hypothetical protein
MNWPLLDGGEMGLDEGVSDTMVDGERAELVGSDLALLPCQDGCQGLLLCSTHSTEVSCIQLYSQVSLHVK